MIMPHVAELQAAYKDKGVTIIGYSAGDPRNTEDQVATFVKKRGRQLAYTFAFGDERSTYDAWMTAAGQRGIPCSFVVDKKGKIVFIGHPLFLGLVLPKVIAGDVNPRALNDEMDKIQEEIIAVAKGLSGTDAKAGLKALADFEAKYAPLANNPYVLREKFGAMIRAGQAPEARTLAESIIAKATKEQDSDALWLVSMYLRGEGMGKELMPLAVKAAEGMVDMGSDIHATALINLANTHFDAGDKAKAKVYAQKAIEASAGLSAEMRQHIAQQAKDLENDKE
jgi:hypothetical protein